MTPTLLSPVALLAQTPSEHSLPSVLRVALGLEAPGTTLVNLVLIALGMLLIIKGGVYFTDNAVAIARATRIPPAIIGATIVSMATTFPEFMVSMTGALSGIADFAVGNAIGSCSCNIGLIVGSCAVLKGILSRLRQEEPGIPASRLTLMGPGAFMIAAGILVWILALVDNRVPEAKYSLARWQGVVLLGLLAVYLGYSLRMAIRARYEARLTDEEQLAEAIRKHMGKTLLLFLAGAALVVLGSRVLVANAEAVAKSLGVPELFIGLTVLAIGTSLPEYTISLMSVIKGHGSLGIGNIIGANVLNICWVTAACAVVSPIPIQRQTIIVDFPATLLLMVLLPALGWKNERISALAGAILLTIYVAYVVVIYTVATAT